MSNPSEDIINCHAFNHTVIVIVDGEYLSVPLSAYIPSLPDVSPNEIDMDNPNEWSLENFILPGPDIFSDDMDMDDPNELSVDMNETRQLYTLEDLEESTDNRSESEEVDWLPFPLEDCNEDFQADVANGRDDYHRHARLAFEHQQKQDDDNKREKIQKV